MARGGKARSATDTNRSQASHSNSETNGVDTENMPKPTQVKRLMRPRPPLAVAGITPGQDGEPSSSSAADDSTWASLAEVRPVRSKGPSKLRDQPVRVAPEQVCIDLTSNEVPVSVKRMSEWFKKVKADTIGEPSNQPSRENKSATVTEAKKKSAPRRLTRRSNSMAAKDERDAELSDPIGDHTSLSASELTRFQRKRIKPEPASTPPRSSVKRPKFKKEPVSPFVSSEADIMTQILPSANATTQRDTLAQHCAARTAASKGIKAQQDSPANDMLGGTRSFPVEKNLQGKQPRLKTEPVSPHVSSEADIMTQSLPPANTTMRRDVLARQYAAGTAASGIKAERDSRFDDMLGGARSFPVNKGGYLQVGSFQSQVDGSSSGKSRSAPSGQSLAQPCGGAISPDLPSEPRTRPGSTSPAGSLAKLRAKAKQLKSPSGKKARPSAAKRKKSLKRLQSASGAKPLTERAARTGSVTSAECAAGLTSASASGISATAAAARGTTIAPVDYKHIKSERISDAAAMGTSIAPADYKRIKSEKISNAAVANTVEEVINVDEQPNTSRMADGLWDTYEVISNKVGVDYTTVKRVVDMLEKGATLPFICRYRREESGGISMPSMQSIHEEYKRLLNVRKKAEALSEKLASQGHLTPSVREAIFSARTCDELDLVSEPFKPSGPRTHAGKARSTGLEPVALSFLRGETTLQELGVSSLIDPQVDGKRNLQEVLQSIQYILADELRKSREVLDAMDAVSRSPQVALVVKKKKKTSKTSAVNPKENEDKFQNYFQFQRSISSIESHQVMAINRGENLGFLSVNVNIPEMVLGKLKSVLRGKLTHRPLDAASRDMVERTISDCLERLCKPYITRLVRSQLKDKAETEAIQVFSSNLRALLMTPPVRGEAVLGIDPGFSNGCKMAMISRTGELLQHGIIFPTRQPEKAKAFLAELVRTHNCSLVAVGDGKGSQQVKALITACNREGRFGSMQVRFSTVREAGVSVYSVTAEAEEELPGLDTFVKGAVAIARRLQDPLVEYVKVEPRHLGIGMYQHDVNEAKLKEALQGTVVECVSFVGVDLNVCPEFLLRQVAGLNATAARNIIQYRQSFGPFMNREQLQLVPHIGPIRYEQCAGFVKILPETVKRCLDEAVIVTRVKKPNMKKSISEEFDPLDTTIIHPESYGTARELIKELRLDVKQVGSAGFINTIVSATNPGTIDMLQNKLKTTRHTVEFILKALAARRDSDLRDEGSAPIFSESLLTISDLRPGDVLRGKVTNVVPFGAFVDVALENDVLLHSNFLGAASGKIRVGDAIEGKVMSIEVARNRVALSFVRFL